MQHSAEEEEQPSVPSTIFLVSLGNLVLVFPHSVASFSTLGMYY